MTKPYLLAHPNPHGPHYYTSRRGRILAIVVHVTAGLEDLDATDDHSAERTARYAATTERRVSWHSGSDTDSAFDLLPDDYTAFHVRGYNSTTLGHEISKKHTDWHSVSRRFRDASLLQAARHLGPKAAKHGIPFRVASLVELDRAIANNGDPVGFIGHHTLDPSRRTDPGLVGTRDTFPWHEFLELARHAANTDPEDELTVAQYDEIMAKLEVMHTEQTKQHARVVELLGETALDDRLVERETAQASIRTVRNIAEKVGAKVEK